VKKSLLLSAVIFSLLSGTLAAQGNDLDITYSGSQTSRLLENNLNYSMTPLRSAIFNIKAMSSREQRMNFSQQTRHSILETGLSIERGMLLHSIRSGYEYLYDSSQLEEATLPYSNKTGFLGYSLDFSPADSLHLEAGVNGYIRSEEDRYVQGNKLNSDGYLMYGRLSAGIGSDALRAGLNANLERKRLDWEYYLSGTLNAYLNHQGDKLLFNNNLNLNQRNDDFYILSSAQAGVDRSQYNLYDKQQRRSLVYSGVLEYRPWDFATLTFQDDFSNRITALEENTVRNNADLTNQASLALNLSPAERLDWETTVNHSYAVKEFNFTQNTRQTENRFISSNLGWEYIDGDTLSVGMSVDLQRTSFPDDGHRWDNDLRNIRLNLGSVHYWRDRLKLSNRLLWHVTDDVYVSGVLSGNNKRITSYVYNPACAVLIGDRMLFNQDYTIRADYTDYVFDTSEKALYRQLTAEYKLVFDSFPYAARSNDQRWMLLPYRNQGDNAFLLDLTFAYERNEYAENVGSYYMIDFTNTGYTASITLKHDIRDIYYVIRPQYAWGTWKEYSLLVGFAWKFTSASMLEFSLNPVGNELDNLDWKTSVSLSASF
jgi:hypothetical protein